METFDSKKESDPTARLVEPTVEFKDSFIEGVKEFQAEGRDTNYNLEDLERDFTSFLDGEKDRVKSFSEDFVPESVFWLVANDEFIGITRVRHRLNDKLLRRGGNIGYEIRSSKRQMGYGTKILELALEKAKELGLERVLLTCNKDNPASRKIIESHGGVMENEYVTDGDREPITIQHFWIEIK